MLVDSDSDSIDDPDEIALGINPLNPDTDFDGIPDNVDPEPLIPQTATPELSALEIGRAIILGAVFGEAGIEGGSFNWLVGDIASSPYYVVGWIGFSVIPVVGAVADIRDAVQAFINGDELGAAMNAAGVVPGVGDIPKASSTIRKFITKYSGKTGDAAKALVKYLKYADESVKLGALDAVYDGAASALKNKGVLTSRIDELVGKGIDLLRHNEAVDLLKSWWGKRAIKGADHVAEILGDEIIKAKYPASQGYVVKYKVTFYDSLGGTAKEVDTVVLNSEGKLIAFGETKSKKTLTSFEDAETQISDTKRLIVNRAFDGVKAGDGSEIDVSKVQIEYIQETFKIGPADAPYAYEYKLAETSSELDEIYRTFSAVK